MCHLGLMACVRVGIGGMVWAAYETAHGMFTFLAT